MTRYANFDEKGRSIAISNAVPDGGESNYLPIPDDVHGTIVVKDGKKIRELNAKEIEAILAEITVNTRALEVRSKRNRLLIEADVLTQMDRWEGYSDAKKKKITAYKQGLRDITKQKGFPTDVTFPEMPE
jgi:hypothetical protein